MYAIFEYLFINKTLILSSTKTCVMQKILLPSLLFIFILTLSTAAQNFNLVKDINTSKDGNPDNHNNNLYIGFTTTSFFINSTPTPKYAVLNGITYFSADDGIHGTELWRSDKTAAGTYMVKDITAGSGSSNLQSLVVAGNKLYFVVGIIVYESDGTDAGTFPVPGISYTSDQTTCLTAVGNMLYFFTNVSRLWKTDGTLNGTSLVIDFRQVYNYARDFLGQLTNVNGTAYFTTGDDNINGPELWKSDGTQAGTVLVKDIYPGTTGSRPCNLTSVNGKLYFSADDGTGIHLWTSNGTEQGTYAITNQSGAVLKQDLVSGYIDITPFAVAQKTIYFKASTASKGYELYKYNTTNATAGVTLVKDIVQGEAGSNPANITAVDNSVFFSATSATGNQQLWKTNGSTAGTIFLISEHASNTNVFSDFVAANGLLLFACYTDENGSELWSSDGTAAGTGIIKDIYAGKHSSAPSAITYIDNGKSLFSANNGSSGVELWKTDGTASGTVLVKNINDNTTGNSNPVLTNSAYYNGQFYFSAYDPVYSNAPYKTNGTAAGTHLLKDIFPGNSSNPAFFTNFKNNLYFSADSGGYNSIYKTDGTNAGTIKIFNTGKKNASVKGVYAGSNNLYIFYFNADDSTSQLWATDGTASGFYKIQDIYTTGPVNTGTVISAVTVNNTIYFSGYDPIHGSELWKATATAGSAKMIKDILPGVNSSGIYGLIAFNNKVCFRAQDSSNNLQSIFISDGTKNGTIKLHQGYEPIAKANNRIFFSGYDVATGQELYTSDGTLAGTKLVKDISATSSSYPTYLTSADSIIYFEASDDPHGYELWKSDGTKNGTTLVKDIFSGIQSSSPYNLTLAGNKLYFQANNGINYYTLFVTNGKASGTHEVNDAGLDGVTINALVAGGNKLYLNGYTYALGSELYASMDEGIATAAKNNVINLINKNFTAAIIGNPVRDVLQLSVYTATRQNAQITIRDINGKVIATRTGSLNTGSNLFSFEVRAYSSGIYIVSITGDNNTAIQLKFVK